MTHGYVQFRREDLAPEDRRTDNAKSYRLSLGTCLAMLLMSVGCTEFNCFPRGSLQQIEKKTTRM